MNTAESRGRFTTYLNDLFQADRVPEPYVLGTLLFNPRAKKIDRIRSHLAGVYEDNLSNWMRALPEHTEGTENRVLLLIGTVGSGKSSAISQSIAKTEKEVRSTVVDFRRFGDTPDRDQAAARSRMFTLLSNSLAPLSEKLPFTQRAQDFWHFCFSQKEVGLSEHLQSHLHIVHDDVQIVREAPGAFEPEDIRKAWSRLQTESDAFERGMSPETRFLLSILQIKYRCLVAGNKQCVVLDNVDGIPELLQPEIVHVAYRIAETAGVKVLVTLRPLTYTNAKLEHTCQEEHHLAPKVVEVVSRRIASALASKRVPEEFIQKVQWLSSALEDGSAAGLGSLIEATSGHCVRLALIHMSNLAQSDAIRARPLDSLKQHQIAHAYFFAGGTNIRPERFELLYSVGHKKQQSLMLVKARILDFVLRISEGMATGLEIVEFMKHFGHSSEDVCLALNEENLTHPHRELLLVVDKRASLESRSYVETPLGQSYIGFLFGEYRYDQACEADRTGGEVLPNQVVRFDESLAEIDFEELSLARRHIGQDRLKIWYSKDEILSVQHWSRLAVAIPRIQAHFTSHIRFNEVRTELLQADYLHLLDTGVDQKLRSSDYRTDGPNLRTQRSVV